MLKINITKKLHGTNGDMNLNVNLSIKEGEFVAISGQSGSGKTTFLRILAGLEEVEGSMVLGDEVWLEGKRSLAPQQRNIGFVFQDYALFENMSVEENLLFVRNDRAFASQLLEVTELTALKKRMPKSLSGGQKQRVALCRALMNRPKLLLLDEPLSALDVAMRLKLQDEILELHKKLGLTVIMVSHDPSEIYRLASRVLVLENGVVVADGIPKEVLMKKNKGLRGEVISLNSYGIATVLVGQQLVEVKLSVKDSTIYKVGEFIDLGLTHYIGD